ncbi:uncharacterized protein [Haliotis cracherodii]|uniref:uncharacterized protein n=1 Tax=Haliotis cracherodii TaxID=6455 RepID=UPI0039E91108
MSPGIPTRVARNRSPGIPTRVARNGGQESAPVLATNRRVPVEGVSFSITCTLDAALSRTTRFHKDESLIMGGCTSSGSCGTPVSGYSVRLDSTSRILTLDIASPDSTRDSGTWTCSVGTTVSNNITLSQVAAVLDWSSVTFSQKLTSLPSSVTPQNTISVKVTTPCAAPAAVITWRYQQPLVTAHPLLNTYLLLTIHPVLFTSHLSPLFHNSHLSSSSTITFSTPFFTSSSPLIPYSSPVVLLTSHPLLPTSHPSSPHLSPPLLISSSHLITSSSPLFLYTSTLNLPSLLTPHLHLSPPPPPQPSPPPHLSSPPPHLSSGVSGVPPSNTSSSQGSCPSGQVQTTNTLSLPGNTDGVSGVPPSSTSSSQGSCPSGQVQTTNTLSLPGNTASLYNRQVSLTVSVEHDSFDPPTYTKSVTSNTIQFPVPVTSVTLTNISSDNEEIGQAVGQSLTLTCVTSASFPTSTVTWVTLPSGTTPTVSTETTSGVLVKTTSSVTFTVSKTDQGRSIHCQAENINGQTSPQSNRATLEVWYGPDTNQVRVTKPANTVVAEDRDLTLTCETLTSVSPGVTFTWDYSDGSGITGGSTGSVTGSASTKWSQTRTFRPVRSKTDVRCSVRNTRTAVVVTKTLSLGDVKYPPPGRPTVEDFHSVMYAGVQKTISCTVTGGNPLADITWSCYNTSNTGSESSREGTKTSSLTFLVTKHQNSRQCQCGASWMYGGYNETVTQTLTVYYPPDKPTTTNPGTLCEGKSTSLTCSSSPDHGNPPATFYWTKNNAAVHTGSSYTFSPVKADNGADIRCAAGNNYTDRAGSSRPQSDARLLSVYYVGVPTLTPAATQTRKEGQSLSLTCAADGNPDNTVISWNFNDSPILGSSVMKADLNRSDDGEYGCTGRVNTGSVCPGGSLQGRSTVRVIVNCE